MLSLNLIFFCVCVSSLSALDDIKKNNASREEVRMKLIGLKPADDVDSVQVGHPVIATLEDKVTSIQQQKNIKYRKIKLLIEKLNIEEVGSNIFNKLENFMAISLAHNKLKNIKKETFSNNEYILGLDFSNNQITEIEEKSFENMAHLTYIILYYNKIKTLSSNWYTDSPKLVFFLAGYNLIEEIPENAFKGLDGIRIVGGEVTGVQIDLGNNKIKKIHPTAFNKIFNLDKLNLGNNSLVYEKFPEEIFRDIFSIKEIDLSSNDIRCVPKILALRLKEQHFNCTY